VRLLFERRNAGFEPYRSWCQVTNRTAATLRAGTPVTYDEISCSNTVEFQPEDTGSFSHISGELDRDLPPGQMGLLRVYELRYRRDS
jgi:hypothetical protein